MRLTFFFSRTNRRLLLTLLIGVVLTPGRPALAHIEKGSTPDSVAEMEYRILLEFNPQDQTTRSLLGMALVRQGKFTEAEKEFRTIIKGTPNNFDALDGLGITLYKTKRYDEALQHFSTARKLKPDDIMVHLHLGQLLTATGNSELARATLVAGLTLLDKQPPSANKEQQQVEFKAALANLPQPTTKRTKIQ